MGIGPSVLIWMRPHGFPTSSIYSRAEPLGSHPEDSDPGFTSAHTSILISAKIMSGSKSHSGLSSGVRVTYSRGIFKTNTGKKKSSLRSVNHTAEDAARTQANMARQKASRGNTSYLVNVC
jgi:hypothetical protein